MVKTKDQEIQLDTLDIDSNFMAIFGGTTSTSCPASLSQLRFIFTLVEAHGLANIIQFGSSMSKRLAKSLLAAELLTI